MKGGWEAFRRGSRCFTRQSFVGSPRLYTDMSRNISSNKGKVMIMTSGNHQLLENKTSVLYLGSPDDSNPLIVCLYIIALDGEILGNVSRPSNLERIPSRDLIIGSPDNPKTSRQSMTSTSTCRASDEFPIPKGTASDSLLRVELWSGESSDGGNS